MTVKGIFLFVSNGWYAFFKSVGLCGLLVALLAHAGVRAVAATPGAHHAPLSKEQVLGLVEGGVANQRVVGLVRSRKIDFNPTAQYLGKLRSAGASQAVIEAVRQAAPLKTAKTLSERHVSVTEARLSEAQNNQGIKDLEKGDRSHAIAEFQEALRDNPENAQAHNNLGLAFAGIRELNAAINEYYAALRLDPGYTEARYNLAIALELEGDAQDAVAAFREVAKQKPDDPLAHFGLATALERNGDSAGALEEYRIASKLAPNNLAIRERYVVLLQRHGNGRNE